MKWKVRLIKKENLENFLNNSSQEGWVVDNILDEGIGFRVILSRENSNVINEVLDFEDESLNTF